MISKRLSTLISLAFLLLLLGAMAYLNSFQANDDSISTFQIGDSIEETDETIVQELEDPPSLVLELEYKLVETNEVDGELIEKYQEFEIYKDSSGKIIKSIPTNNFNYLRYQK